MQFGDADLSSLQSGFMRHMAADILGGTTMIPVQGYKGQKVAVLGLGRSGRATAAALQAGGAVPIVWDDSEPARDAAFDAGFDVVDLSKQGAFDDLACLIVSPGIPHLYPSPNPVIAAAWAAGVPVDNDISLFFGSFATRDWQTFDTEPRIVAVTGSNGKSTTSALIHHILSENGRPTQLAGNIGRGVLDIDPAIDGEVVVLELSSYQTELARALTPDIAVFTNLSPDHLDRHAGFGGYFAAKRRLFSEGGPERAIIGVDEDEGLFSFAQLPRFAAPQSGDCGQGRRDLRERQQSHECGQCGQGVTSVQKRALDLRRFAKRGRLGCGSAALGRGRQSLCHRARGGCLCPSVNRLRCGGLWHDGGGGQCSDGRCTRRRCRAVGTSGGVV